MLSNLSKSVSASAVDPANPAMARPPARRRILRAVCFITTSPTVTWPSPAIATSRPRRTARMVVARISPVTRCVIGTELLFFALPSYVSRLAMPVGSNDVAASRRCAGCAGYTLRWRFRRLRRAGFLHARRLRRAGGCAANCRARARAGRGAAGWRAGRCDARAGCLTCAIRRGAGGAAWAAWALGLWRAMPHHDGRALLCATHQRAALHADRLLFAIRQGQQATTLRARNGQWPIPGDKVAGGVIRAAVEYLARLLAAPFDQIAATFRAEHASLGREGALVGAFRIPRTRDELAKATRAQQQWLAAFRTGLIQLFDRLLHLAHLFFGKLQF